MHEMVRESWRQFNLPLEGQVPYMYLDVRGYVSTGIGNKIDETKAQLSAPSSQERDASLNAATKVQWTDKETHVEVGRDEVAADWDTVKSRLDLAPQGHTAFEDMTRLRLSDEAIFQFVSDKLAEMEIVLVARPDYADFDNWPASAQLATLSMCWAMGPAFNFPTFGGHVAVANWRGAADECHFTPDVSTIRIRNKLDRMHFLNAAAVAEQGLPIENLSVSLSEVLGVQHALHMLGFKPGPQDGGDGPSTQAGVSAFQASRNLAQNGVWNDPDTQTELGAALSDAGWLVV